MLKRFNISRKPVSHLLEAIKEGDIDMCQSLLSEMNKRQVNKLKRPKYPAYSDCAVTPLIWAVMNRQHHIAEMLLCKGASTDRLGYYVANFIIHKLSPLLRAIDHYDDKMVDLLVKYGANIHMTIPGTRLIEEEGGSARFINTTNPIDYSFGKKITIYQRLLAHADMSREYGVGQHTCFCNIVKSYCRSDDPLKYLKYVHIALQYGGKICRGRSGSCSIVCELIQLVSDLVHGRVTDLSAIVGLVNCLYFVCCSDYMHRMSPIYLFPKLLASKISHNDVLHIKYTCDAEKQTLCRLTWILNMANTPSTLQEISRATIRHNHNSCTPQTCSQLPLPSRLIDYVSCNDTFSQY
ncbi:hypothetical protein ACF0H5_009895 [Mactra antiquata]